MYSHSHHHQCFHRNSLERRLHRTSVENRRNWILRGSLLGRRPRHSLEYQGNSPPHRKNSYCTCLSTRTSPCTEDCSSQRAEGHHRQRCLRCPHRACQWATEAEYRRCHCQAAERSLSSWTYPFRGRHHSLFRCSSSTLGRARSCRPMCCTPCTYRVRDKSRSFDSCLNPLSGYYDALLGVLKSRGVHIFRDVPRSERSPIWRVLGVG